MPNHMTSLTVAFAAPAAAGAARTVPLGHAADTNEPVAYVATTHRAQNGLIVGAVGTGKSTLVERITGALSGWTIRHVDADDQDAASYATTALQEAQWVLDHGRDGDPPHLFVWDGLDRLLNHRRLDGSRFAARLAALAEYGPTYGVAQLATTQTLGVRAFGDRSLRDLLADNLIALRNNRGEHAVIDGLDIAPSTLPRCPGHALVKVTDRHARSGIAHVHLDGAQVEGCSTCWRAVHDQLAAPAAPPAVHAADAVFGFHPPTGLVAYQGRDGRWRFLDVPAGEELLSAREVADLREYPVAAS